MRADGTYVVPEETQDGIDRMLHPLGSMHVIRCERCGGAAHAYGMPEEFLYSQVASMWHCHTCGALLRIFIGAWGSKLPARSYAVPGVRSTSN